MQNNIGLIIRREYTTRVRNKVFLWLTFLGPVFYGLLIMMPLLVKELGKETKLIQVSDESGKFVGKLPIKNTDEAIFAFTQEPYSELKKQLKKEGPTKFILHIPKDFDEYHPKNIELLSQKNVSAGLKTYLDSLLGNRVTEMKMEALRIGKSRIDSLKTRIDVKLQKETDKGLQESSSTATSAASFIGGFLMYIFIFLYGSMVLRGVQEEKQNRVVEVMISSVKPFQLMLGKIIGIALVGLTQFFIWVGLAILITAFSGQIIMMFAHDPMLQQTGAQVEMNQAAYAFNTLPIGLLIGGFIFYFSCGYLLYSSLFAAVGAAVDSQTDSNQFMFPISIPIFLAISMIPSIMDNPDSTVAFWFSIIPLTSPIIMMARLPFEVPAWQIILSALVLIAGFLVTTWAAAKIYRTGILMYGKKVTFKELGKWLFYKD